MVKMNARFRCDSSQTLGNDGTLSTSADCREFVIEVCSKICAVKSKSFKGCIKGSGFNNKSAPVEIVPKPTGPKSIPTAGKVFVVAKTPTLSAPS